MSRPFSGLAVAALVRVGQQCDKVALRGPSGKLDRWLRGAWRLPESGRYSFLMTGCWYDKVTRAQLTKIRLRPLRVDGAPRVVVDRSHTSRCRSRDAISTSSPSDPARPGRSRCG